MFSFFMISVISGQTALMWSSGCGHGGISRFLVESGANLEAKDDWCFLYPKTCCFESLALPQPMFSCFLISVISGNTALMGSSGRGHHEITRFLVESGAN
jgi:ankyrin repeat protein